MAIGFTSPSTGDVRLLSLLSSSMDLLFGAKVKTSFGKAAHNSAEANVTGLRLWTWRLLNLRLYLAISSRVGKQHSGFAVAGPRHAGQYLPQGASRLSSLEDGLREALACIPRRMWHMCMLKSFHSRC